MPSSYYIIKSEDYKYEVVQNCNTAGLLKYEIESPHKCITFEECRNMGKFINEDESECVNSCSNFIYNSKCVSSCQIDKKYYNHGTKICISQCTGDYLYHTINGNECFYSCNDISPSGTYKYLRGNICSSEPCIFYTKLENNVQKCYDSVQDCINDGFEYLDGNECILECPSTKFKVNYIRGSNGKIINLGRCFVDQTECRNNNYYFYNIIEKKCWHDTCKSPYHIMELDTDNHPIDIDGNTCVDSCPNDYSLSSDNYCINNCQSSFYDVEERKCISECGSKYLITGTNRCTNSCNYYFINNLGKKECLGNSDNCLSIDKYYFSDNPSKCIDECVSETKKYYFYNNNHECLESCTRNTQVGNYFYAEEPISTFRQCLNSCGTKYYYDDDKICRDKESCVLFKTVGSNICVTECGDTEKVNRNNECVANCDSYTYPYFVEEKVEIRGEKRAIKRCINKICQSYSSEYGIIYASDNGLECLKTCYEGFYKDGDYCYRRCEGSNTFIDIDYSCKSTCSTNYYEKLLIIRR